MRDRLRALIRYFVGTELGVANLLQRHFDWLSNTLWFEEIPNACDPQRALYVMGGKDSILDSKVRSSITWDYYLLCSRRYVSESSGT